MLVYTRSHCGCGVGGPRGGGCIHSARVCGHGTGSHRSGGRIRSARVHGCGAGGTSGKTLFVSRLLTKYADIVVMWSSP